MEVKLLEGWKIGKGKEGLSVDDLFDKVWIRCIPNKDVR